MIESLTRGGGAAAGLDRQCIAGRTGENIADIGDLATQSDDDDVGEVRVFDIVSLTRSICTFGLIGTGPKSVPNNTRSTLHISIIAFRPIALGPIVST